jgi:hypothetical protein
MIKTRRKPSSCAPNRIDRSFTRSTVIVEKIGELRITRKDLSNLMTRIRPTERERDDRPSLLTDASVEHIPIGCIVGFVDFQDSIATFDELLLFTIVHKQFSCYLKYMRSLCLSDAKLVDRSVGRGLPEIW